MTLSQNQTIIRINKYCKFASQIVKYVSRRNSSSDEGRND
jgi:hypothetical protein